MFSMENVDRLLKKVMVRKGNVSCKLINQMQ